MLGAEICFDVGAVSSQRIDWNLYIVPLELFYMCALAQNKVHHTLSKYNRFANLYKTNTNFFKQRAQKRLRQARMFFSSFVDVIVMISVIKLYTAKRNKKVFIGILLISEPIFQNIVNMRWSAPSGIRPLHIRFFFLRWTIVIWEHFRPFFRWNRFILCTTYIFALIRWGFWLASKKSKLCEIAIKMRIRNFQFGSLNFRTRLQFYRRKSLGTGARLIMHICWRLFKVLYSRWRRYYGYQWAVLVVQTNGLGITEK